MTRSPEGVTMPHTPGPWEVNGTSIEAVNATGGISSIASVNDGSYLIDGDWEANARLIASAPALLAALKVVLRYCVTVKGMPDSGKGRTVEQQTAFDTAQAAIHAAEGGRG